MTVDTSSTPEPDGLSRFSCLHRCSLVAGRQAYLTQSSLEVIMTWDCRQSRSSWTMSQRGTTPAKAVPKFSRKRQTTYAPSFPASRSPPGGAGAVPAQILVEASKGANLVMVSGATADRFGERVLRHECPLSGPGAPSRRVTAGNVRHRQGPLSDRRWARSNRQPPNVSSLL